MSSSPYGTYEYEVEPEPDGVIIDPAYMGWALINLLAGSKTLGHTTPVGTCIPYLHRPDLPPEGRFLWDVFTTGGDIEEIDRRWPGLLWEFQKMQAERWNPDAVEASGWFRRAAS